MFVCLPPSRVMRAPRELASRMRPVLLKAEFFFFFFAQELFVIGPAFSNNMSAVAIGRRLFLRMAAVHQPLFKYGDQFLAFPLLCVSNLGMRLYEGRSVPQPVFPGRTY